MAVKEQLEEIKEESFAMEILRDQRKQNKRLFIIWIITFAAFVLLASYTIYLLNDIGFEEITTKENYDVNQESGDKGNNNFINGNGNEVNNNG